MKKILIVGAECTGKTTLASELAGRLGGLWVPEFARAWVQQNQRAVEWEDVDTIVQGQKALAVSLEMQAVLKGHPWLVYDTSVLLSRVYSQRYFGKFPEQYENWVQEESFSFVFLTSLEVPWKPEQFQRSNPTERGQIHLEVVEALEKLGWPYQTLKGSPEERLASALATLKLAY